MAGEPVTYSALIKYLWLPVLGLVSFLARKSVTDLEKRMEKLEKKQEEMLTEDRARTLVKDLIEPLHVKQDATKESIDEVKNRLIKITEKL